VSRRAEPWPAATAATAPVDRGPGATGLIKRAGHARASARAGGDGSKRGCYATTRGNRFSGGSRGVCRDREARTHNAIFASVAGWQSGGVTSGGCLQLPIGATPARRARTPERGSASPQRGGAHGRVMLVQRAAMRGGGPGGQSREAESSRGVGGRRVTGSPSGQGAVGETTTNRRPVLAS
jgi:hypothetical protein